MIGHFAVGSFAVGQSPAATGGAGQTISPATGAIILAGNTPTIAQPKTVTPATGGIVVSGGVPSVSQTVAIAPATGQIVVAGNAPAISQPRTLSPAVGEIVVAGGVPTVSRASAGTGATAEEIWSYEIAPGITAGQALLDIYRRLGLDASNPLAQTATQIAAGSVLDLALSESGGTVTVTRQ